MSISHSGSLGNSRILSKRAIFSRTLLNCSLAFLLRSFITKSQIYPTLLIKIDYIALFGSAIELATIIKSIINFKSIYPAFFVAIKPSKRACRYIFCILAILAKITAYLLSFFILKSIILIFLLLRDGCGR